MLRRYAFASGMPLLVISLFGNRIQVLQTLSGAGVRLTKQGPQSQAMDLRLLPVILCLQLGTRAHA